MYHRGEHADTNVIGMGSLLGNSRNGGNCALLLCLGTHFLASLVTLANYVSGGCAVSAPVVIGTLLFTAYAFWAGVGRIYMPPPPSLAPPTPTPRPYTPSALDRRID